MRNKKDRLAYSLGNDPEYWANRALNEYSFVDADEAKTWAEHPCTQVLILALQADITGITGLWMNGGYANNESIDDTAQTQAKARGMAQANNDTIETIGRIGNGNFGEIIEDGN